MEYGECARCGAAFPQRPGKGRPRKFCDLHRRNRKYGSRHEALRRDTIAQALRPLRERADARERAGRAGAGPFRFG
jgi:hypothetical protein